MQILCTSLPDGHTLETTHVLDLCVQNFRSTNQWLLNISRRNRYANKQITPHEGKYFVVVVFFFKIMLAVNQRIQGRLYSGEEGKVPKAGSGKIARTRGRGLYQKSVRQCF